MVEKKINGRKHVQLKCPQTDELFWKDKSEYTRRIRENPDYVFYSSLKAKADAAGEKGVEHLREFNGQFSHNLKRGVDRDEYSPFRYFIKQMKLRAHRGGVYSTYNLDLQYLKDLWESQKGICPYSGHQMALPPTIGSLRNSPLCASLDRIDSNIGYVKGNVEFVCQLVNLGKNNYPREQVLEFFNANLA